MVVKISCFTLTDTMDSLATLGSRVLSKTLRDLQSHLVQIVGRVFGSLEFIGKPAGLYRNVGEGVKEFFYEVRTLFSSLLRSALSALYHAPLEGQ